MSEVAEKYSVEEVSESLSYQDEVLMETWFQQGQKTKDWSELSGTKTLRALLFVIFYRKGMKHEDAFKAVTEMPLGEVNEHFTEEDDADEPLTDDGEPETAVGKDVGPHD